MSFEDDVYRLNAEITYFMAETFWGKGIATEAIRLMCDYTFKSFDLIRIVAGVFEYNKASMSAREKNEFALESIQKVRLWKMVESWIITSARN